MRILGRIAIFLAVYLAFEIAISWLAFCHPNYQQAAYYEANCEYCALRGPFVGVVSWGWSWLITVLHDRDKEIVAAFTVILTISTVGLWISTRGLWAAGNRALVEVERSFVFVKEILLENAISGDGLNIRIRWRNSGSTPARRVRSHISHQIFHGRMPDDWDFPDCWNRGEDREVTRTYLGPEGEMFHSLSIADQNIQALRHGYHLYVWGWSEYEDAFNGPLHRTEFCAEVAGRLLPDGQMALGTVNYRRHNGADDDCYRKPGTPAPELTTE